MRQGGRFVFPRVVRTRAGALAALAGVLGFAAAAAGTPARSAIPVGLAPSRLATVPASAGAGTSGARAGTSPTAGPPQPAAVAQPCRAADLAATGAWQGAGGMLVGSVGLTNRSATPCMLRDLPRVALLDARGERLSVEAVTSVSGRRASGTATVTIGPGERVWLELGWTNWCGPERDGADALLVALPDGGGELAVRGDRLEGLAPRCDAPGSPSRLAVGPYAVAPTPSPTRAPGHVGLRAGELADIVEMTVLDHRKASGKTSTDPALIRPVVDALAGARFVRAEPEAEKPSADLYLVYLKRQDGATVALLHRSAGSDANVADPGPREWWLAPGLDRAMRPLLPPPLTATPTLDATTAAAGDPVR